MTPILNQEGSRNNSLEGSQQSRNKVKSFTSDEAVQNPFSEHDPKTNQVSRNTFGTMSKESVTKNSLEFSKSPGMDSNDFSHGVPVGTISGVVSADSLRADFKNPGSKPTSSALRSPINAHPSKPV